MVINLNFRPELPTTSGKTNPQRERVNFGLDGVHPRGLRACIGSCPLK